MNNGCICCTVRGDLIRILSGLMKRADQLDAIIVDPDAITRVKALFTEAFELPEDTMPSLAELRCHEPDCSPIETGIVARAQDAGMREWRIGKPITEISEADIALINSD